MILELHQLGQLVSSEQEAEAPLVQDIAKVKRTIKGVKEPRYMLLPIHFDLDRHLVEPLLSIRFQAKARQLWDIGAVNFGAPRGRKHYPAVLYPKNLSQWEESLFGKEAGESDLLKWCAGQEDDNLRQALLGIQDLEPVYREWLGEEKLETKLKQQDTKTEPLVIVYACVSLQSAGWDKIPLAQVGNYQALYRASRSTKDSSEKSLCYFSGKIQEGVAAPDSTNRYNLNKLFVTTTFNYAPTFEKANYDENYQISPGVFQSLEAGSGYLLKKDSPLQLRIAGLPHVVLPRILVFGEEAPFEEEFLEDIQGLNLSLFSYHSFAQLTAVLENQNQYWSQEEVVFSLTYIAFESDGNSTKVVNTIREVQHWQFARVREQLLYLNHLFAPWLQQQGINLYSIFQQLPIIKGASRNIGLRLLGDLLENKTVDEQILFQYCCEALNCHRYARYKAYDYPSGQADTDRIWPYTRTIAYYQALRLLLYRLGQLKAGHHVQSGAFTDVVEYEVNQLKNSERMEKDYDTYFQRLGYNTRHRALFFLGRALDRVAYAQYQKKNSKTVLNALDFSGMDKKKILHLAATIENKAQLYRLDQDQRHRSVLDNIRAYISAFSAGFDLATWDQRVQDETQDLAPLTGKETVFYIMSGYTYGAHKKLESSDAEDIAAPASSEV